MGSASQEWKHKGQSPPTQPLSHFFLPSGSPEILSLESSLWVEVGEELSNYSFSVKQFLRVSKS